MLTRNVGGVAEIENVVNVDDVVELNFAVYSDLDVVDDGTEA